MKQQILIYQLLSIYNTPSIHLSLLQMSLNINADEIDTGKGMVESDLFSRISILTLKKYDTMFSSLLPDVVHNPLHQTVLNILNPTPDHINIVDWAASENQRAIILRLMFTMAFSDGEVDSDEWRYINDLRATLGVSDNAYLETKFLSKKDLMSKLTLSTINEFHHDFIKLALIDKDLDSDEKNILKELSSLKQSLKSLSVLWP